MTLGAAPRALTAWPAGRWWSAAAVAAVVSLGLPWSGSVVGHQTPARVLILIAAVPLVVAVRRHSPRWGLTGLAVAGFALPLAGLPLLGGGAVYAVALVLLTVALRRSALLTG